jgi:VanZ family protein
MPIERPATLVLAAALLIGILAGSPVPLADPADKAVHFIAFSLLALLLWKATGMPLFALAAAVVFAGLDEWRQAYIPGRDSDATDFLADVCGVLATGALLFMQRKTECAESSPR